MPRRFDDLPVTLQLLPGALVLQLLLGLSTIALLARQEELPAVATLLALLVLLGLGLGVYAGLSAWLLLGRSRVAWTLLLLLDLPASVSGTGAGVLVTALTAGSALLVVVLLLAPPTLRCIWTGDLRRPG